MSSHILKPFGPTIFQTKISSEIIESLNNYAEKIILDKKKTQELDIGHELAGNVQQEFKLEADIIKSSGWGKLLADETLKYIYTATKQRKKITKFNLTSTWMVRQFENDYNPLHNHSGHISGVGYLKIPSAYGAPTQEKKMNNNGHIQFVDGVQRFLCDQALTINPEEGDLYLFPSYLQHTVYPFKNPGEERRSISFNAYIDPEIYTSL